MNVVEARKLAKKGLEDARINVLRHIDKLIEESAKIGRKNVVVNLDSRRVLVFAPSRNIFGAPLDEDSIRSYKDYLTIAGFTVDELDRESDVTTSLELVISWEENE